MKAQVFPWRNKGLVFLSVPKNACSSIKYALRVARKLPLPDPEWKIHEMHWPEEMEFSKVRDSGFISFAVIRDPIERIVSCFRSKMHKDRIGVLTRSNPDIKLGISFERFVEIIAGMSDSESDEHFAEQEYLLSDDKGLVVNTLIPFEKLDVQWKRIAKHLLPPLRKLNSSSDKRREPIHVTSHAIDLLAERYEDDYNLIERMGDDV